MIIRLSQKLNKKIKAGKLDEVPLDENEYADWSAHLFTADRSQYIILSNTKSLYSCVMFGKGITNDSNFMLNALSTIRDFMGADGQQFVYEKFVAPASGTYQFAKALNRSVTGSMNELVGIAKQILAEGELSPHQTGFELNGILLSSLKNAEGRKYAEPRDVFKRLTNQRIKESDEAKSATDNQKLTVKLSFTKGQRKIIAEILPHLSGQMMLDKKALRTHPFTITELQKIQEIAQQLFTVAEDRIRRNSLRHIVETTAKAIEDSEGIGSIRASERLYQFKITLNDLEPAIWRRIQVKDCTLDKFHEHIQSAMGWTNSHLHQFKIRGEYYGDPALLDDGYGEFRCINSLETKISDIVPKNSKPLGFQYDYDFGDGWQHEVLFEGCLPVVKKGRYPVCLEGERSCPPEDIGGVWGYADFLQALSDPQHEQHKDYKEWIGDFDAEKFDATKITEFMKRGLPNWREM